ncbi:type VI secretion system protein TssA [Siccirubricoccus phaeus]|uniref:type VI secretion system protein TssA n=1 Tax=Siccirubricoccus phaeus TaxID=2595053 RepID=UPI0011F14B62|nr:type VI secretion system protein TssA [Siccirubricoccus phaeus]
MAEFDAFLETAETGPDLEFDPDFLALTAAAAGKPEQQFGSTIIPAEDPDWREVEQLAAALLERSRDIRIIAHLAVARLHTGGIVAYTAAVGLIARLLDTHWDAVHPTLDPDDDNDPTMRANAVLGIAHVGRVIRVLREVPLTRSQRAGSLGWSQIALGLGLIEADPEATPPTEQAISAAFNDTDPGWSQAVREAVARLAGDLKTIVAAFEDKAGAGTSPDLSRLEKQVFDIRKVLDRFPPVMAAEELPAEEEAPAAEAVMVAAPRRGGAGFASVLALREVQTRQEAVHLMDVVVRYFETHEPSSPLPLLIRRALRLSDKNFLDVLRDLAPDGVNQAQLIVGVSD